VPLSAAEEIATEEKQLARLRQDSFDPERNVIVPVIPAFDRASVSKSDPGEVTNYEDDTNSSRIHLEATAPSIVVLSQIFYPDWKVYIDGKPAELLRLDYAFTGTVVGPGNHDVEFRFQPTSFVIGAAISFACLLFSAILWLLHGKKVLERTL
jgi:hypothetical protein